MAESSTPKQSYSSDPNLFLYTSLTAGSSHIITATSRLETILKANRIPFLALDLATDEKARMLWGRRAGKDETGRVRKLPGLVQEGVVLGDLVEVEEWNEYGELKQHVKIVGTSNLTPLRAGAKAMKSSTSSSKTPTPQQENKKPTLVSASTAAPVKAPEPAKPPTTDAPSAISLVLQQAGQEAAQKAKDSKKIVKPLSGIGQAEPAKKEAEKTVKVQDLPFEKLSIYDRSSLQSPTSTVWKKAPGAFPYLPMPSSPPASSVDKFSLQSPNSTTWKPTDVVMQHRGSSISLASADEIKKIEEECAIPEEDEEGNSDNSDSDEEEEEENNNDSDSDDEEDEKKVAKPEGKTEAKRTADESKDSDKSDEENTEVQKNAPPTAKPVAKHEIGRNEESDDDDDDSDEEEKKEA